MKSFCLYFSVCLLIVVALIQNVAARTTLLSAWKCGGFGMFATNEHNRFHKFYVVTGRSFQPIVPDSRFDHDVREIWAYPSEAKCEKLANEIANFRKIESNSNVFIAIYSTEYIDDDDRTIVKAVPLSGGQSRSN